MGIGLQGMLIAEWCKRSLPNINGVQAKTFCTPYACIFRRKYTLALEQV